MRSISPAVKRAVRAWWAPRRLVFGLTVVLALLLAACGAADEAPMDAAAPGGGSAPDQGLVTPPPGGAAPAAGSAASPQASGAAAPQPAGTAAPGSAAPEQPTVDPQAATQAAAAQTTGVAAATQAALPETGATPGLDTDPDLPDVTGLPDPNGYAWQPVVAGLDSPVGMAYAPDGSGRLFVLEQAGRVRIVRDGLILPEPFLDIRGRVGSQGNEQGLLGLAFHPRFTENGFFYVNYTNLAGDTVIARFQAQPGSPNTVDAASEKQLLFVEQPYANHNGGVVQFGPDGLLYLGLGDGGAAGDPNGNAQSLDTLLGKLLRIDVDRGDPYAIPPGSLFANGGGRPEIFAYGLRNPWRMAFDRRTGDLYIADVGQNQWEEINFLRAGSAGQLNFGWDYYEASHPYEGQPPAAAVLIMPVAEYDHSQGCSVTGGEVYRGRQLPAWQGVYLYGDFCTGTVWGLVRDAQGAWQSARLFENVGRITAFGQDEAGELYLVDRAGMIYRLAAR